MGSLEHGSQETGPWGGCLVLSSCCFWPRSSAVGRGGGIQEPGMLMNHAGATGDRSEVGTKTHNPEPAPHTLHSSPNKR